MEQQGISNPELFGDLLYKFKHIIGDSVYEFKTIIGNSNFSDILKNMLTVSKRVRYDLNIMRQTVYLVFNQIMIESYAPLFSCTATVHF